MNTETKLGKIKSLTFGLGGYQDVMLGLHICIEGQGWGTCTSDATWDSSSVKCDPNAKWTEEDRSQKYDEIMRYISSLLAQAKVRSVDKLIGIPVEATFEAFTLKSWRILTEVL